MKLIALNCPNCGAHLTIAPDKTEAWCEHCDTSFLIEDESEERETAEEISGEEPRDNKEQVQSEGKKDVIKPAQSEDRKDIAEPNQSEGRKDVIEPTQSEDRKDSIGATQKREAGSVDKVRTGNKAESGHKAVLWIALGVVLLLLIVMLGKCGARLTEQKDGKEQGKVSAEEPAVEETNEGILDLEAEELADQHVVSEEESNHGEDAEERDENILGAKAEVKGRGLCDEDYKEPNYVGLFGYVSIYKFDDPLLSLYEIPKGPWYVPKYALYEGKYLDTEDKVEHKTPIEVLGQTLHYEDVAKYGGYLLVEDESGERFYIDVSNFVTKDYWSCEDLKEALETGYYLAEYHQKSGIPPVTHDNEALELEEGTLVFVRNFVPGEWSVNINKPHHDTTPIEGLVWGGWYDVNEYGARGICFSEEDLEIVY